MVLIQVYSKCVRKEYKVRILSKGTLIFVITTVLSVILPFILAYGSKGKQQNEYEYNFTFCSTRIILLGFWMKRDTFYEVPDIRFQGKYIFVGSTNDISMPIICSSYPILMENFKNFSLCSQIKVRKCYIQTLCINIHIFFLS